MPATRKRVFDKEFKRNAVKLYESSGKSLRQLGQELGVSQSAYGRWVQETKASGVEAFPGKGCLKPLDAELAKLRRELAIVREVN